MTLNTVSATTHSGTFCTQTQTFPDKDLPIGAVVQDEAVVPDQQLLPKRTLLTHFGDCHGTRGIRHLTSWEGDAFGSAKPFFFFTRVKKPAIATAAAKIICSFVCQEKKKSDSSDSFVFVFYV